MAKVIILALFLLIGTDFQSIPLDFLETIIVLCRLQKVISRFRKRPKKPKN